MDSIRQLVDRRNREHLPVSIILVTSYGDVPALKSVMKNKEVADDGLSGVYFAGTPLSGSKVYDLGGIINANGSVNGSYTDLQNLVNQSSDSFGDSKLSKEGLNDPMILKAWWYLSNGEYGAYSSVKKLTKKKGSVGEEAQLLVERVETMLAEKAEGILGSDIADIESYENAERLSTALAESKIKDLSKASKELKNVLKDAKKVDTIKDELKARTVYSKLMGLTISMKPKERQQAKDGLLHLSRTMPGTHYGQLAGLRASSLAGL